MKKQRYISGFYLVLVILFQCVAIYSTFEHANAKIGIVYLQLLLIPIMLLGAEMDK